VKEWGFAPKACGRVLTTPESHGGHTGDGRPGCGARRECPPGARPIKVVRGVRGAEPPGYS
jgi:hypothetical protein